MQRFAGARGPSYAGLASSWWFCERQRCAAASARVLRGVPDHNRLEPGDYGIGHGDPPRVSRSNLRNKGVRRRCPDPPRTSTSPRMPPPLSIIYLRVAVCNPKCNIAHKRHTTVSVNPGLGVGGGEHDDRRVVLQRIGRRGRDRVLQRPHGGRRRAMRARQRGSHAGHAEALTRPGAPLEHPV